jgi:hypothetical protein
MKINKERSMKNKFMVLGILIGAAFGILIGLFLDKLALFLGIGAGIGLLLGIIVDAVSSGEEK